MIIETILKKINFKLYHVMKYKYFIFNLIIFNICYYNPTNLAEIYLRLSELNAFQKVSDKNKTSLYKNILKALISPIYMIIRKI